MVALRGSLGNKKFNLNKSLDAIIVEASSEYVDEVD